jgi:hypothetical protein
MSNRIVFAFLFTLLMMTVLSPRQVSAQRLTEIFQSLECAFWNISPAQNLPSRGFALVWE